VLNLSALPSSHPTLTVLKLGRFKTAGTVVVLWWSVSQFWWKAAICSDTGWLQASTCAIEQHMCAIEQHMCAIEQHMCAIQQHMCAIQQHMHFFGGRSLILVTDVFVNHAAQTER
jgi:hypothetical protein